MNELLTRYGEAGHTSRQATDAVSEVAGIIQAPSRALTLARSTITGHGCDTATPGTAHQRTGEASDKPRACSPGPVETTLLDLGVTNPAMLARGADIDHDAERLIIDATATTQVRRQPRISNRASRPAGAVAPVSHAVVAADTKAAMPLRPPVRLRRAPPEREP